MTLSSNGITASVIRDIMPPYNLSNDLLEATFAALPPPPRDASSTWRQTRITRLIAEIAALMPADAAQARIATQILVVRELADTLTNRAHLPGVTIEQMCRLSRSSAEMTRTAALLERTLARHQQKPVPFFGTVVADEVDIAALDAVWCGHPARQPATPEPAGGVSSPRLPVPGVDPVGSQSGGETAAQVTSAPAGGVPPAGGAGAEVEIDQPAAASAVADAPASPAAPALPAHSDLAKANVRAWCERMIEAGPGMPVDGGSSVLDAGFGAARGSAV